MRVRGAACATECDESFGASREGQCHFRTGLRRRYRVAGRKKREVAEGPVSSHNSRIATCLQSVPCPVQPLLGRPRPLRGRPAPTPTATTMGPPSRRRFPQLRRQRSSRDRDRSAGTSTPSPERCSVPRRAGLPCRAARAARRRRVMPVAILWGCLVSLRLSGGRLVTGTTSLAGRAFAAGVSGRATTAFECCEGAV